VTAHPTLQKASAAFGRARAGNPILVANAPAEEKSFGGGDKSEPHQPLSAILDVSNRKHFYLPGLAIENKSDTACSL